MRHARTAFFFTTKKRSWKPENIFFLKNWTNDFCWVWPCLVSDLCKEIIPLIIPLCVVMKKLKDYQFFFHFFVIFFLRFTTRTCFVNVCICLKPVSINIQVCPCTSYHVWLTKVARPSRHTGLTLLNCKQQYISCKVNLQVISQSTYLQCFA